MVLLQLIDHRIENKLRYKGKHTTVCSVLEVNWLCCEELSPSLLSTTVTVQYALMWLHLQPGSSSGDVPSQLLPSNKSLGVLPSIGLERLRVVMCSEQIITYPLIADISLFAPSLNNS